MARPSRGFSESIGIWKCWFLRRGENLSTQRKTSRNKDENQQQTQPTYDAESGNRTWATLVGGLRGRQMLNHCTISGCGFVSHQDQRLFSLPCAVSNFLSRANAKWEIHVTAYYYVQLLNTSLDKILKIIRPLK